MAGFGTLFILLFSIFLRCSDGSICNKIPSSCLTPSFLQSVATSKVSTYVSQQLIHCTNTTSDSTQCKPYWLSNRKQYNLRLKDHYDRLIKMRNHSLNLMNHRLDSPSKLEKRRRYFVDVAIDTRCHHSWPYNPYHKYADCLMFILPALYNFLQTRIQRDSFHMSKKVALLVDESTEMLCEYLNLKTDFEGHEVALSPSDVCLLANFQALLRTKYYYQCVKVSIFHQTAYWYKLKARTFMSSNELIWLEQQRNPFASGSGFKNQKHENFTEYAKDFRRIMFEGFCQHCQLPVNSSMYEMLVQSREFGLDAGDDPQVAYPASSTLSSGGGGGSDSSGSDSTRGVSTQNVILVLKRAPGTGRDIPQQDQLMTALQRKLVSVHRQLESEGRLAKRYQLLEYSGSESNCETIALFWSSKVIIAAHGAGIVNTVFSRPNSLLIEISPDALDKRSRGRPWRMNSPFAQSVGLSAHIVVVPHNASARNEGELQKVYSMSLTQRHIDFVAQTMSDYLVRKPPKRYEKFTKITSLVQ